MAKVEQFPEIIGREIQRVENALADPEVVMGKERRREAQHRAKALRWALHVSLTSDPTRPPGVEVEAFLGALKGRREGTP